MDVVNNETLKYEQRLIAFIDILGVYSGRY